MLKSLCYEMSLHSDHLSVYVCLGLILQTSAAFSSAGNTPLHLSAPCFKSRKTQSRTSVQSVIVLSSLRNKTVAELSNFLPPPQKKKKARKNYTFSLLTQLVFLTPWVFLPIFFLFGCCVYFCRAFLNYYFVFPSRSQVPRSELMSILGTHPVLSSNLLIALIRVLMQLTFHMAERLPSGAFLLLTSEGKEMSTGHKSLLNGMPKSKMGEASMRIHDGHHKHHTTPPPHKHRARICFIFSFPNSIASYSVNHSEMWATVLPH